jgi:hypothetical protein
MRTIKRVALLLLLVLTGIPAFLGAEPDPPSRRVPMSQARATALRAAPGKVRDFEFEIHKDRWVYFFKIIGKDRRVHRLFVDAVTGKITAKSSEPMAVPKGEAAVKSP